MSISGGAVRQALVCNENSHLCGSMATDTTRVKDLHDMLSALKRRPNFNPKVCVLDNAPPQLRETDGRINSSVIGMLVECLGLPGPGYVIQVCATCYASLCISASSYAIYPDAHRTSGTSRTASHHTSATRTLDTLRWLFSPGGMLSAIATERRSMLWTLLG